MTTYTALPSSVGSSPELQNQPVITFDIKAIREGRKGWALNVEVAILQLKMPLSLLNPN